MSGSFGMFAKTVFFESSISYSITPILTKHPLYLDTFTMHPSLIFLQCRQGTERRGAMARYSEVAGGALNSFLEALLCHSSRF